MAMDFSLYELPYTGQEVEAILRRVFLNNSGFIRLESSIANPVDLDTVVDYALDGIGVGITSIGAFGYPLGNFLIEYYIHGPNGDVASGNGTNRAEYINCSPLSLFNTIFTNPDPNAGGTMVLHQTAIVNGAIWTRWKALVDGSTFSAWTSNSNYTASGDVTDEQIDVYIPSITTLEDNTVFFIKVDDDVAANATISINGSDPIPIYTGDGNPVSGGTIKAGSVVAVAYNKELNRMYLLGGSAYGKIYVQKDEPTGIGPDTIWYRLSDADDVYHNSSTDPSISLFDDAGRVDDTTVMDPRNDLVVNHGEEWIKTATGVSVSKFTNVNPDNQGEYVKENEDLTLIIAGYIDIPCDPIPDVDNGREYGYARRLDAATASESKESGKPDTDYYSASNIESSPELYARENTKCTVKIYDSYQNKNGYYLAEGDDNVSPS